MADARPEPQFDAAAVRRAFGAAAASYDAHAALQREVGIRLAERLDYMKLAPQRVLDLGCGTGAALPELRRRFPQAELVALDLAPAMLDAARARLPQPGLLDRVRSRLTLSPSPFPLHALCADMHRLPLATNSVGLAWSSLALQWANDLPAVIHEVHRTLAPGGAFVFATFGPDTLKELRRAFAAVDDTPHVSRFVDLHDIGDMLVHAGFQSPVMEMEMLTLTYADLKALMRDLKGLGAHNASVGRAPGLFGRHAWAKLEAAYETLRVDGRLPASWEVVYGHAWAGDKTRREDGRQVIELKIAQRRGGLAR